MLMSRDIDYDILRKNQQENRASAYLNKGLRLFGAAPMVTMGVATKGYMTESGFYSDKH
ncbi:hypothetical protein HMPREF0555_1193 [Leuconostoc mesenteroides subsp. cremoris ATCC 19254]|uniref:Uncharacterized protein n=2 Tax=Leuconostoc mesenteroides TaxID=1245 RepID=C2KKM7_LEUMC|nr:hypothetical protein HMPREF0555_1193 [Leuconostoc mesenteroides subsp. cremoris ATCC 19254]